MTTEAGQLTDTEIDQLVLQVLAGQNPDYLIHADASAFVAVGLDAPTVVASLARLEQAGQAREDEIAAMTYATDPVMLDVAELDANGDAVLDDNGEPVMTQVAASGRDGQPQTVLRLDGNGDPVLVPLLDDAGNEVTVAAGWCITDTGTAALS